MNPNLITAITRSQAGIVVHLHGEIDLHRSPEFHTAVSSLLAEKPLRLVLNLSDVDYMDSSGVGTLVDAFRRIRRHNGRLFLVAPSQRVRSVLEITKLDQFFAICTSDMEALES